MTIFDIVVATTLVAIFIVTLAYRERAHNRSKYLAFLDYKGPIPYIDIVLTGAVSATAIYAAGGNSGLGLWHGWFVIFGAFVVTATAAIISYIVSVCIIEAFSAYYGEKIDNLVRSRAISCAQEEASLWSKRSMLVAGTLYILGHLLAICFLVFFQAEHGYIMNQGITGILAAVHVVLGIGYIVTVFKQIKDCVDNTQFILSQYPF